MAILKLFSEGAPAQDAKPKESPLSRFLSSFKVRDEILERYGRCDCDRRLVRLDRQEELRKHAAHLIRGPVGLHVNEYVRIKLGLL